MSDPYQKFLKKQIDLTPLGIQRIEDAYPYFCTPKGAKIIGWAGADGIHYGFIRGFGKMVFAISPMNVPGDYVHPLAKDFTDFLRLLLSCGSADALEQAHCMNQEQFARYLQENAPTEQGRAVMEAVKDAFGLVPMEEPFAYIKELQNGFDYSRIHFTEDYEDFMDINYPQERSEWGVYFEGGFGCGGNGRMGREIRLDQEFDWEGEHWRIPAVYLCGKGLVADLCLRVSAGRILDFIEKYNLTADSGCEDFDYDTQMQIDADNPLCVNFTAVACVNGSNMEESICCSITWNPCIPQEGYSDDSRMVMEHYGLDADAGWVFFRISFPWAVKRKPQFSEFTLTLKRGQKEISGPKFEVSSPGDTFCFTHPVSGVEHVLTVQEYNKEEREEGRFGFEQYEYPKHYIMMMYTVSPELSDDVFFVRDCEMNESPRQKEQKPDEFLPQQTSSSACCIIGGAYSQTAIVFGKDEGQNIHAAVSACHFEPQKAVWRVVFRVPVKDDMTVSIVL